MCAVPADGGPPGEAAPGMDDLLDAARRQRSQVTARTTGVLRGVPGPSVADHTYGGPAGPGWPPPSKWGPAGAGCAGRRPVAFDRGAAQHGPAATWRSAAWVTCPARPGAISRSPSAAEEAALAELRATCPAAPNYWRPGRPTRPRPARSAPGARRPAKRCCRRMSTPAARATAARRFWDELPARAAPIRPARRSTVRCATLDRIDGRASSQT
jgi:hypothetical protein